MMTPGACLVGGALIGLSAGGLLLGLGRIAGVSGILGRALARPGGDLAWRVAFLVGLPAGAWLTTRALGDLHGFTITRAPALLLAGGFLVGFGTQLGSGCTSGHGVCGMARGSPRSLAATGVFMAVAAATVFAMRHIAGIG